jgi:hypothetical protein
MSISARATHVLSTMLIVAFASTAAGWTRVQRSTGHCTQHTHTCTPVASLTCCCPTAPAPVDRARTPRLALPLAHVLPAALMDHAAPRVAPGSRCRLASSGQRRRLVDLGLCNPPLLI